MTPLAHPVAAASARASHALPSPHEFSCGLRPADSSALSRHSAAFECRAAPLPMKPIGRRSRHHPTDRTQSAASCGRAAAGLLIENDSTRDERHVTVCRILAKLPRVREITSNIDIEPKHIFTPVSILRSRTYIGIWHASRQQTTRLEDCPRSIMLVAVYNTSAPT